MLDRKPQGWQIGTFQLPHRLETLGSSSEVNRFRVQFKHRLLIERLVAGESAEFGDQFPIRSTVGGTDPDKDPCLGADGFYKMRFDKIRVDTIGLGGEE